MLPISIAGDKGTVSFAAIVEVKPKHRGLRPWMPDCECVILLRPGKNHVKQASEYYSVIESNVHCFVVHDSEVSANDIISC